VETRKVQPREFSGVPPVMTRNRSFPVVAFLLVGTCLVASAQQQKGSRFDQWDKDGNGTLSREELPPPARRNFDRVDRNGDGKISREEDAAFVNRLRTKGKGKGTETIRRLSDISYADSENPRQTLDLFLPKDHSAASDPLPLIVFIHGGGWRNGDKRSGFGRLQEFVASGHYAGASIGYRLTDEAIWPAQIHDCKAALRWLRANAEEHGIDPGRIGVWGTSAGGHLVAMLGVTGAEGELAGDVGENDAVSSRVTCVVNFFGPSELLTMNDHDSTMDHDAPDSPESRLIGGAIQENPDKAKNASPIEWVTGDDAPSLIVHGTADPLVPYPQSTALEEKLEAAGVETILLTVEDGGHGRGFGPSVNEAVTAFFGRHLRGIEGKLSDQTVAANE